MEESHVLYCSYESSIHCEPAPTPTVSFDDLLWKAVSLRQTKAILTHEGSTSHHYLKKFRTRAQEPALTIRRVSMVWSTLG